MAMSELEKNYNPREWDTVSYVPREITRNADQIDVMDSESQAFDSMTRRRTTPLPNLFLWDYEAIMADFDPIYGGAVLELTADWNGYPTGSLIILYWTVGESAFSVTNNYRIQKKV